MKVRMPDVMLDDGDYRMTREERQKAMDELNARKRAYEEEHGVSLADMKKRYRIFEEISRNWG